jgi:heme/copper-type cytochrome/quinol oxidase subunit 4
MSEKETHSKRLIKLIFYITGFPLAIGLILLTIYLSLQNQLAENSYVVGFLGIIAVIFLIIARRMSEKQR